MSTSCPQLARNQFALHGDKLFLDGTFRMVVDVPTLVHNLRTLWASPDAAAFAANYNHFISFYTAHHAPYITYFESYWMKSIESHSWAF